MEKRKDLKLLKGAIDMHVHSAPALFHRHEALEIVEDARTAGLRALVLKHHHFPTLDRVHYVSKMVPDIDLFSSITLNYAVGGVNPFAVHAALELGVKVVWFSTIDTVAQKRYFNALGGYGGYQSYKTPKCYRGIEGIRLLDDQGDLLSTVEDTIDLIADAEALLFIGHLTHPEVDAVVDYASEKGVRICIDHPHVGFLNLPLEKQKQLVQKGVILNYCFSEMCSRWYQVTGEEMAKHIKEIGSGHIILSSDAGQIHNPLPSESLRLFYQILMECGVSYEEMYKMTHDNPASLLYT